MTAAAMEPLLAPVTTATSPAHSGASDSVSRPHQRCGCRPRPAPCGPRRLRGCHHLACAATDLPAPAKPSISRDSTPAASIHSRARSSRRWPNGRRAPQSKLRRTPGATVGPVGTELAVRPWTEGVPRTYLANDHRDGVTHAPASEGRLNAYVVASDRVPVVLVTGDDCTCIDAAGYGTCGTGSAGQGLRLALRRGVPAARAHVRRHPVQQPRLPPRWRSGMSRANKDRFAWRSRSTRRSCWRRDDGAHRRADRSTPRRQHRRTGTIDDPYVQGRDHVGLRGNRGAVWLS